MARNGEPPCKTLVFDDNRLLPLLFGEHNTHLTRIEYALDVKTQDRGNTVEVCGPASAIDKAERVMNALWERLRRGEAVHGTDIDAAIRLVNHDLATDHRESLLPGFAENRGGLPAGNKTIRARSATQARYLEALDRDPLVFGIGPAGSGKTYLAVAQAVNLLLARRIDRIILSRPAVEAGERLGFLPGDMKEKVDPYLRPLYDALHDMMPNDRVAKLIDQGTIEIAPLAFMRGRTLSRCFAILDEAQNTTPVQMKMFLTRLGEDSRMAVTGDLSQVDLPAGVPSGLADALRVLEAVEGVSAVRFREVDVVRHPLVARIVAAYDRSGGSG